MQSCTNIFRQILSADGWTENGNSQLRLKQSGTKKPRQLQLPGLLLLPCYPPDNGDRKGVSMDISH